MDTTYYHRILEAERVKLERELDLLGTRNNEDEPGWVFKVPTLDILRSDDNEAADQVEETHISAIVFDELTARYRAVHRALERITDGTYGSCGTCNSSIEEDRLQANPAARTCKLHLADEAPFE